MAIYECAICGWIYNEAEGCPEEGIAPGTRWEDIPDDWSCPICGASKGDFLMVPVAAGAFAQPAAAVESASAPVVIIGSGLAAYNVAREFRKHDGATPLVLITRDGGGYYSKPSLSNALASRTTPDRLETRSAAQMADELKAEVRVRSVVTAIDTGQRALTLADGSRQAFDRLVIAWGADPLHPELGGDAADAVFSVNDFDDYARFHASLENAKSVAVIGAGLIGCEFANDLLSHDIRTTLIGRSAWPLDRLLPEAAGRHFAGALAARGIEVLGNAGVKAVWKDGAGYRVELVDGRSLSADRVLSAIGLQPRVKLASAAGISCRRGIVTDRLLATNVDGIYAVGDCAEVDGINLPFIAPILHQARALGATLAGQPTPVSYPAMPVVVKTPACPTIVCPPPAGSAGSWRCEPTEGGLQAFFEDPTGRLLGFALLGSATAQSQALAARLPPTLP